MRKMKTHRELGPVRCEELPATFGTRLKQRGQVQRGQCYDERLARFVELHALAGQKLADSAAFELAALSWTATRRIGLPLCRHPLMASTTVRRFRRRLAISTAVSTMPA